MTPKITSKAPSKPKVESEGVKPAKMHVKRVGSPQVKYITHNGVTWIVRVK